MYEKGTVLVRVLQKSGTNRLCVWVFILQREREKERERETERERERERGEFI